MSSSDFAPFAVQAPATAGNLGPGFDCLGLAFEMRNTFEVWPANKGVDAHTVRNQGSLPADMLAALDTVDNNLFFKAYNATCARHRLKAFPLRMIATNHIPTQGGMGSSATAVAAGVAAAYRIHNLKDDRHVMLADALHIEAHPDNLAPCLMGGAMVAFQDDAGKPYATPIPLGGRLRAWVVYPHQTVSTEASRKQLPAKWSQADVVYSLSRACTQVAALMQGDFGKLWEAMQDKLHQPYRLPQEMAYPKLMAQLACPDMYGWSLSGSGPSLLFLCRQKTPQMETILAAHFAACGVAYSDYELEIASCGVQIVAALPSIPKNLN